MSTLTDSLARFEAARAAAGYSTGGYPRTPATADELETLEQAMGAPLHTDVIEWFSYGNGAPGGYLASLFFQRWALFSVREAIVWTGAMVNEDSHPEQYRALRPLLPILVTDDEVFLVRWQTDSDASVWFYDEMTDEILSLFAPSLTAALDIWETQIGEPPE